MSQSNTQSGDFAVRAGEDLSGKEGYLVKLTYNLGIPEVVLPDENADLVLYFLIEGNVESERVSVRVMDPTRNMRLKLKGACNPGDVLVLADVAVAADKGKVRALPTTAGTYRGLAVAEEAGTDGQLVLARMAYAGMITIAGA